MKIPKPIQADLALILITFIWGSTFTIVKQSLENISPILFVALRFWMATVLIVTFMRGQFGSIQIRAFRQGTILSLTLLGGLVLQTIGLRNADPSYSAFITSLSVLLVPLLGFVFFRHRPRPQTILGVIVATAGLFLLLARISELSLRAGDVPTLLCAILFGLQILLLGRYVTETDYRQLILLQTVGTAVLSTIAVPIFEKPFVIWDSSLVFSLLATGVLATAFAFYVQARAQRLTTANHAALIFSLEPFFAALFAYWILGQVLTSREWAGGMLVVTGILISELQLPWLSKRIKT